MSDRRRTLTRLSGNLFDQVLSALSNVALSVFVARSVDALGFGSFSVAFLVYGIFFASMKSLVGQPLQIRYSSAEPEELSRRVSQGAGTTLVVSVVAAAGVALVGTLMGGTTGEALLMLAIWLPSLLIQDFARMAFFALGRPWSAAIIDGVWAAVQFPLLAVVILSGNPTLDLLMGAWGVGATVSGLLGLVLLRALPRVGGVVSWAREQRTLSTYLLSEYVLGLGAAQIGTLLVGVMVGQTAVGSLRAAQVLLGPLGILGMAAFQFAVPEVARRTTMTSSQLRTFGLGVSGGLLALHIVYVTALLVMPDEWGAELFSDSWHGASLVLLPMALATCFSCLANGPAGVLYGLGHARATFRINLFKGPLIVVLLIGATALWGVVGSAWAFMAIEIIILPFWIVTLYRASARPRPLEPVPAT